jgi:hypothetical protein
MLHLQVRTTRCKVRAITCRINNILKGYPAHGLHLPTS